MTLFILDVDGTLTNQEGNEINWDLVRYLQQAKEFAQSKGENITFAFATSSKSGSNLKAVYSACSQKEPKSSEDLFLISLIEQSPIFLSVRKNESVRWGKEIAGLENSQLFSLKGNEAENSPEVTYCLKSNKEKKSLGELLKEHKDNIVMFGNDFHDQAFRAQIDSLEYKTHLIDAAISKKEFVKADDILVVGRAEDEEYEAITGFVKPEYQAYFRDPDKTLKQLVDELSRKQDNQFLTWKRPGDAIDPVSGKNVKPTFKTEEVL